MSHHIQNFGQNAAKDVEIAALKSEVEFFKGSREAHMELHQRSIDLKEKYLADLTQAREDFKKLNDASIQTHIELEKARGELETERMKLAGCGVAAMCNTESTAAQRIDRDNPYWSASYGDVCAAVDREMKLRTELEALKHEPTAIVSLLSEQKEEICKLRAELDKATTVKMYRANEALKAERDALARKCEGMEKVVEAVKRSIEINKPSMDEWSYRNFGRFNEIKRPEFVAIEQALEALAALDGQKED